MHARGPFLTGSVPATLHPGSHHSLPDYSTFLEPWGDLHCKWCLLGPRNNINHCKTIMLHNLYIKKKSMKLWLELIFLALCVFLIHTNNETLICPSGWGRLWKKWSFSPSCGSWKHFECAQSHMACTVSCATARDLGARGKFSCLQLNPSCKSLDMKGPRKPLGYRAVNEGSFFHLCLGWYLSCYDIGGSGHQWTEISGNWGSKLQTTKMG